MAAGPENVTESRTPILEREPSRLGYRLLRVLLAAATVGTVGTVIGLYARVWSLERAAERAYVAGDWATADAALERWLWYRPGSEPALQMRVEVALRRDDRDLAIRLLGRWPATSSRIGEVRLQRALLLKEQFRIHEAEADFLAASRALRDDPEPRRQLIGIYGIERREGEQIAMLWSLYRTGRRVEALRLLGQSGVVIPPGTIAKTSDEGEILERCLAVEPNSPHLRAPLARFYRNRGETEQVARLLGDTPPSSTQTAELLEWLATRIDEGDAATVARWFEAHRAEVKGHSAFAKLEGDWHALEGRHEEAVRSYRVAQAGSPRDAEIPFRLAESLRTLGRRAEAEAALAVSRSLTQYAEQAAAVDVSAPRIGPLLAAARAAAGLGADRIQEARAWFEEALRLDPSNQDARDGLAAVAAQQTVGGVP